MFFYFVFGFGSVIETANLRPPETGAHDTAYAADFLIIRWGFRAIETEVQYAIETGTDRIPACG